MAKFKNMMIKKEIFELLDLCEKIYIKHHPEMKFIYVTKSKVLYEIAKFYITTEPEYKKYFNEDKKDNEK